MVGTTLGGSLTIDFETLGLRKDEYFLVLIDSEEKLRVPAKEIQLDKTTDETGSKKFPLAKGEHFIQFIVESRISANLISSYKDLDLDYITESKAQVAIKKITIEGGDEGGAEICQKCPKGAVTNGITFTCIACQAGTEPHIA